MPTMMLNGRFGLAASSAENGVMALVAPKRSLMPKKYSTTVPGSWAGRVVTNTSLLPSSIGTTVQLSKGEIR